VVSDGLRFCRFDPDRVICFKRQTAHKPGLQLVSAAAAELGAGAVSVFHFFIPCQPTHFVLPSLITLITSSQCICIRGQFVIQ
jgi:hypothetical protein